MGKKKAEDINWGEKLRERHDRWNSLHVDGGGDPFWEDGVNMNLVRNHIINYKHQCEETGQFPEEYYWETPPEVDNHYMARAEEIRAGAKRVLELFEQNKDCQYLEENVQRLTEKEKQSIHIKNVINYKNNLETYVRKDSLVDMRRYVNSTEMYLKSFTECRKKLEEKLKVPKELPLGQISLFDIA